VAAGLWGAVDRLSATLVAAEQAQMDGRGRLRWCVDSPSLNGHYQEFKTVWQPRLILTPEHAAPMQARLAADVLGSLPFKTPRYGEAWSKTPGLGRRASRSRGCSIRASWTDPTSRRGDGPSISPPRCRRGCCRSRRQCNGSAPASALERGGNWERVGHARHFGQTGLPASLKLTRRASGSWHAG